MPTAIQTRKAEFLKELKSTTDWLRFSSKWLFESVPIVFDNSESYLDWRHRLANKIEIDPRCIIVVGSASTGFSLSPNKDFSEFSPNSDVDVAIVSSQEFEIAWQWLRKSSRIHHNLKRSEIDSITDHKNRLIYFATISTDKLLPRLPFGRVWLTAAADHNLKLSIGNREIRFRLYRDFTALRDYHVHGFGALKTTLLGG